MVFLLTVPEQSYADKYPTPSVLADWFWCSRIHLHVSQWHKRKIIRIVFLPVHLLTLPQFLTHLNFHYLATRCYATEQPSALIWLLVTMIVCNAPAKPFFIRLSLPQQCSHLKYCLLQFRGIVLFFYSNTKTFSASALCSIIWRYFLIIKSYKSEIKNWILNCYLCLSDRHPRFKTKKGSVRKKY